VYPIRPGNNGPRNGEGTHLTVWRSSGHSRKVTGSVALTWRYYRIPTDCLPLVAVQPGRADPA
jgi:hypothetical protein